MIIETFITGGLRFGTLPAVGKKTESVERALDRLRARAKATLDCDGISRQCETNRSDTGRRIIAGLVQHQTVSGISLVKEIFERVLLKPMQHFVGILAMAAAWFRLTAHGAKCFFRLINFAPTRPVMPASSNQPRCSLAHSCGLKP